MKVLMTIFLTVLNVAFALQIFFYYYLGIGDRHDLQHAGVVLMLSTIISMLVVIPRA